MTATPQPPQPAPWQPVVAAHYAALPDGAIPHLELFAEGVLAELDDYWPASGTFDEAAWEPRDALTAAKAAAWSEAEMREAWGR